MLLTNCIFHEDTTPSLGVYPDHFFCFGCQAHGSLGDLWASLTGHEIIVAPDRSGSWFNRPRVRGELQDYLEISHHALVTQPHVHWYPADRKILGAVQSVGIGWDSGWLVIPILGTDRVPIGVVWRAYPHVAHKTNMRYDLPRGQGSLCFIPSIELWKESDEIYVVYGIIDAISMVVAGLAAASPTAGKGSFDPAWLDGEDRPVVILPDLHESRDAFELAASLDWRGRVCIPEYENKEKDVNDILVQRGPEGLRHAVAQNFGNSSRSRS
mgnify:CR=1 FL=1